MKHVNIKKMASVALLMAMVIVLQLVSGMIPPVGGFSISLVLIPIVLGAATFGAGTGALLGGAFGLIVFINCVTGADVGGAMVFQANAVMCFVVVMAKGILAGLASGAVYSILKRWNPYVAMLCAAIVCPVVNTGIFVTCMLLFFKPVLSVWAGGGSLVAYIFSVLAVFNFLPELLINIVFSPFGQTITKLVKNK